MVSAVLGISATGNKESSYGRDYTVMPRVESSITCDTCGRDLTSTGNAMGYRIAVANERIPSKGTVVTLLYVRPCLDTELRFCGMNCLLKWAAEKIDEIDALREA